MSSTTTSAAVVMTPDQLLDHWQGHRRLTRRMIEAFPEDQLFTFSIGGMRTFGELVLEMLSMAVPMTRGVVRGEWDTSGITVERTRAALLQRWDEDTAELAALWRQIPASRFQEVETAFGQYTGPVYTHFLYIIENEIHHRGQGYVYLRALGVAPPPFYER